MQDMGSVSFYFRRHQFFVCNQKYKNKQKKNTQWKRFDCNYKFQTEVMNSTDTEATTTITSVINKEMSIRIDVQCCVSLQFLRHFLSPISHTYFFFKFHQQKKI